MSEYDAQQLDMLEPAYLARFDLKQPPFSPALDERFFYLDAERAQRVNLLQHLVDTEDLLLVITGERGSGKTSLLQHFLRHAEEGWRICQVDAHAMMDADQLLWRVAEGFHIGEPSHDPRVLQGMLHEHMAALHRSGLTPVLVVDNAHELPVSALLAIFHLADSESADGRSLLRTILFCEPQIDALLSAPAIEPLRQRVTHTLEMPALSVEQTAEYLQHRLNAAGHGGESLFSLKDIRRIHKAAAGQPGRINEQAHQLLNRRIGETTPGVSPLAGLVALTNRRTLLAGLAIVAIAALLIFRAPIGALFGTSSGNVSHGAAPGDAANIDSGERQIPLTVPPMHSAGPLPTRLGSEPDTASSASPGVKMDDNEAPPPNTAEVGPSDGASARSPADSIDGAPAPATGQSPSPSDRAAGSPPPAHGLALLAVTPDPVTASAAPQSITLEGRGFTPNLRVSLSSAQKQRVLDPDEQTVESDSRLVLHIRTGTQPGSRTVTVSNPSTGAQVSRSFHVTAAAPAPTPAPAPTSAQTPTAAAASLRGKDWILARDPAHFTLQLLSTHKSEAIPTFVRKHALEGDLARFHTVIKGSDWYTLVQGDYPTHEAAQAALGKQPATLGGLKPWVRRFDDIQSAIHATALDDTRGDTKTASAAKPAAQSPTTGTPPAPPPDIPAAHRPPPSAHDESWLWSQDPSAYTLQLLATHQEANIAKFIEAHHLQGKAVYFHTHHDGQQWYSLVYGVYRDRSQATSAIKQLPRALRDAGPWARSFASVQAELSAVKPSAQR